MSSATDRPQEITVTAGSGDDPRFVLYSLMQTTGLLQRQSHQMQPSASSASASSSKADSPTGSASLSGRRASIAGRRWSNARKISSLSTPPPATSSLPTSPLSPREQAPQRVLMAATVERWIAEITSKIESDLMTDFFMTYRAFLSSMDLCKVLQARFEWTLQATENAEDIAARRIVRVRTYVVLRYWLLNFFPEDFVPERELRHCLTDWLNRMGKDCRLKASPTDLRLIKSLKKIVKGYKAKYSTVPIHDVDMPGKLLPKVAQGTLGTRPRAASADSSASIRSVNEQKSGSSMPPLASDLHPTTAFGQPDASLTTSTGGADRARTSSSEDDVDLNIEHSYDSDEQPVIPAVFPISPQRRLNHTPRVVTGPRSPQTEINSAHKSPDMLNPLPNLPEHTRISKYLTSTMGSFGKLKRAMGPKAPRTGDKTVMDLASSVHLRSVDTLALSTGTPKEAGLGIQGLARGADAAAKQSSMPASPPMPTRPELHHAPSSATIKRASTQSRNSARSERQHASETSALQPAFVEKPYMGNSRPETIQLDDYDSSDDESNYGEKAAVVRKIRRLPAARDLRTARLDGQPYLAHRHSINTLSSYGGDFSTEIMQPIRVPSFATYDSHDSSANDGENVVPFFVPPVDSDEEEPGDVEAALRRLEGQVDQAKQKHNAKKVEMYLQKSEVAKANGGFLPPEETAVDEPRTLHVTNPSLGSEKEVDREAAVLGQSSLSDATAVKTVAVAPAQAKQAALPVADAPSVAPKVSASRLAPPSATKSVQRKSSMRRFFGSRTSLAPKSTVLPAPSLAPTIAPPSHRSFLLDHKSDTLARHFTIIERDLLNKVTWQELVSMEWRKRPDIGEVTSWDAYLKQRARLNAQMNASSGITSGLGKVTPKKIGDIQTIIGRFNLMCHWIASESKRASSHLDLIS